MIKLLKSILKRLKHKHRVRPVRPYEKVGCHIKTI